MTLGSLNDSPITDATKPATVIQLLKGILSGGVKDPGLLYMGEDYKALASASVAATIPLGSTTALIRAEGGAVYWTVNNAGAASATSGGYVADGQVGVVLTISNLTSLKLYGVSPAKAHIEFYK